MPHIFTDQLSIQFIHIPKTGGTTIENWMSILGQLNAYQPKVASFMKCSPQHLTYEEIKLIIGYKFDFVFTIVRNPYDRLESEYFFRTGHESDALKLGFSPWLLDQLEQYKKYKHFADNHFRPQTHFLSSEINKIYRLEDGMDNIINDIKELNGIANSDPIVSKNVSKRHHIHWSVEAINKVNRIYFDDFEQLNYQRRIPSFGQV